MSVSSAMSAVGASAASAAESGMSSADTWVSSVLMRCISSAVGGLAVLAGLLLAAILLALLVFVLGIAAAVVAHFERIEQVVHRVAELALVLDHAFQPVEIAPGAVLDQRTPEIDQLLGGRRRRHAGQPLAHQQAPARPRSARRRAR